MLSVVRSCKRLCTSNSTQIGTHSTTQVRSSPLPISNNGCWTARVYRRSDGQQRQAKLLIGGSGGPWRRSTQLQCLLFLAGNLCAPRDVERVEEPQAAPPIEPLEAQMLVGLIMNRTAQLADSRAATVRRRCAASSLELRLPGLHRRPYVDRNYFKPRGNWHWEAYTFQHGR